eukprot:TRINITY_DN1160_c0_g1_i2.p2 TRINITY_DN1160_c0_g1~~TRINITY_DN1160_c0_g1_i2.p2  ORF type:complete len:307 (+),score=81.94 TRINITY_DN1160_c0_g1_i2:124-921(+)
MSYGLLYLGNSGVGKTWLVNLTLGKEAFRAAYESSSVTKTTEYVDVMVTYSRGAVMTRLFNIPGLIENNQEAIEHNKVEIQKAFVQRPVSVVVFVFSVTGGRIRDEDMVAFEALNKSYRLKPESLCIVVNQLNKKKRTPDYERETKLRIESLTGIPSLPIAFINEVDDDDVAGRQEARATLLHVIETRLPAQHEKHHDIQLQLDQIKKAKEEVKAKQEEFDRMKAAMDAEAAKKLAEIEALKNRPPQVVHVYHPPPPRRRKWYKF